MGKQWKECQTLFFWAPKSLQMVTAVIKLKDAYSLEEKTWYVRQQKRHRCIEQSFGLCGRGRGWDDLGDWHVNMYNII